jgi:ankyrin repeat protein
LIAYDILEKILAAFPGPAQVNLRDQKDHTALHFASSSTDIPIVEIIRDHMSQNRDSFEVNSRSQGGNTPLDYVGAVQRSLVLDRTRDKPIFDRIQAKTYDMYRLLRSMGALNGTELQGIVCL